MSQIHCAIFTYFFSYLIFHGFGFQINLLLTLVSVSPFLTQQEAGDDSLVKIQ